MMIKDVLYWQSMILSVTIFVVFVLAFGKERKNK